MVVFQCCCVCASKQFHLKKQSVRVTICIGGVQAAAHRSAKQHLIPILSTQDEACRISNIVSNIENFKYLDDLSLRIIGLFFKRKLFAVIYCCVHLIAIFDHYHSSLALIFSTFLHSSLSLSLSFSSLLSSTYEGWNFNRGNYLFTTDTK